MLYPDLCDQFFKRHEDPEGAGQAIKDFFNKYKLSSIADKAIMHQIWKTRMAGLNIFVPSIELVVELCELLDNSNTWHRKVFGLNSRLDITETERPKSLRNKHDLRLIMDNLVYRFESYFKAVADNYATACDVEESEVYLVSKEMEGKETRFKIMFGFRDSLFLIFQIPEESFKYENWLISFVNEFVSWLYKKEDKSIIYGNYVVKLKNCGSVVVVQNKK